MSTSLHHRISRTASSRWLAAFALAAPMLASAAPKWEMTGDSGKVSVWVDRNSMKRNGNEVRANLEWRWVQPIEVPDTHGAKTYRLERQVQISNCSTQSFAIVEGTRYADAGGFDAVGSYQFDDTLLRWGDAPSRTIRGGVIDHVCRNAPMPDAARR